MKTGDLVIVATEGGKPGEVAYVCADGMIGVKLVNEGGRIDEWNPVQVQPATPQEAAEAAKKFLPARMFE
jgi:hypothetical protein